MKIKLKQYDNKTKLNDYITKYEIKVQDIREED
jgi:hypothetical protein